ncbi:membrane-bound lytic murein transglycosylase B [Allopseudospirillum japonicum]|uniref:Membrane-bound lytic murein transglycosylase B n=1 Tax=Allopseudospirillum japonicum TaxID=64971 RepID=A0A1H6SK98_9GAMM|nr:lytic murein transglycosylase B [Allopseudospirillum japonicum]SEI68388.1 membrane-bound lytic murein transglycosylase B [Allopseudospirillum japonicum]
MLNFHRLTTKKSAYKTWLAALALSGSALVLSPSAQALQDQASYVPSQHPEVAAFIEEMAREHQFDPQQLQPLFAEAKYQQKIIDAISRPAERVLKWHEYRKIFLTESRIQAGVNFMRENAQTLARAEQTYGVPKEIITAIIGVETFYGRNKGSYRVLDALSTLAFNYPPRSSFFRKQLVEFLILAREEGLRPELPIGSYAGAMGYGQFIPSSYRAYAVDFDGDHFRDIWTNTTDAIGSVANYFKAHQWRAGEAVVLEAQFQGDPQALPSMDRKYLKVDLPYSQAQQAGFQVTQGALSAQTLMMPIRFEVADNQFKHWAGLHNFYVITRYNHSRLYAMAVYQLSQAIAAAAKAP